MKMHERNHPDRNDSLSKNIKTKASAGMTASKSSRNLRPLFSTGNGNHNTPKHIIDVVRNAIGSIDLDPCSNEGVPNVPAVRHFTVEDDGLSREWSGRVYMNPPYGREIDRWVEKLVAEYTASNVTTAIALTPARTDTKWWAILREYPVCFVQGRLRFGDAKNSAPFPSAVFYLGDNIRRFHDIFSEIGEIRVPIATKLLP